jgi:hypothetical protein
MKPEEIIEILNQYSTTPLKWLEDFFSKNKRVIDPMDYHKIADEISKIIDQESERRIDELIHKLIFHHGITTDKDCTIELWFESYGKKAMKFSDWLKSLKSK